MARATWLADVLRAAGLTVVEHPGWRERGKDGLDPVWQLFHHTASAATGGDAPALHICIDGRPDLPGPLCHVLVARSGVMHVIAAGVANHAGRGIYPDGSTGNKLSIGWEVENDGVGEPWPHSQLEDLVTAQAAVCRHLSLGASRVIGHKEYTTRKIDPHGIDMDAWRRRVAAALVAPIDEGEDDVFLLERDDDKPLLIIGDAAVTVAKSADATALRQGGVKHAKVSGDLADAVVAALKSTD